MHPSPLEPNPLAALALRFAAERGIATRRHRDFVALEFADGLDEEKIVFDAGRFASFDASGTTPEDLSRALEGFLGLAQARQRVLRGLERRILETGGSIEKSPTHWSISTGSGCMPALALGYRLTDAIRQKGAEATLTELLADPWVDGRADQTRVRALLDEGFTSQDPPAPLDLEANPGASLAHAFKAAYLPGLENLDLPQEAREALAKIDEIADAFAQELRNSLSDPDQDGDFEATAALDDELEKRFDAFQGTLRLPRASDLPLPPPEEFERADLWAALRILGLRSQVVFDLRRNPSTYLEGFDWYLTEEDWLRHARRHMEMHPEEWGSAEGAFLLEKEPKPGRFAAARRWAISFLEEGAYDADGYADTLILLRPDLPELDAIVGGFTAPRQMFNAWRAGSGRLEKEVRDRVLRSDDLLQELDSLSNASAVELARLLTPPELALLRERFQRWARECDELALKLHHRQVTGFALRMEWFEIFEMLRDHPRFDHILWTIGASTVDISRHLRRTLRAFLSHLESDRFHDLDYARKMIERLEQSAEGNIFSLFQEEDLLHWTAIPSPPPQIATIVCHAILEADAGEPASSLLTNHDALAIAWSRLRRVETEAWVNTA